MMICNAIYVSLSSSEDIAFQLLIYNRRIKYHKLTN